MTFLSALGTPIVRRFEIWVPDTRRGGLVFQAGIGEEGEDLAKAYAACTIERGAGTLGHAWRAGIPAIARAAECRRDPVRRRGRPRGPRARAP